MLTNKLLLTIYYKLNWKACIDLLVASLWNKQGRDAGVRTHVRLAGIQSLSQRIARELPSSRRLAEYRVIAQLVAYGGFDL